jgi:uncharacterized protein YndB with AHSA1/START domain
MESIMPDSVIHDTFVLDRSYPHNRDKLFRALSDPALKARWFFLGNEAEAFDMDFRVGGRDHQRRAMGADTPFQGRFLVNEGRFEDIVPGERIVMSTTMTLADKRISSALITYELSDDGAGCRLRFTHQAAFYEGADGPEMRRGGWEKLLDSLAESLETASA